MILLRLFWLIIGILIGLILIPALIIGAAVLFGFCLLFPLWFPIVTVIAGAILVTIGIIALLTPK